MDETHPNIKSRSPRHLPTMVRSRYDLHHRHDLYLSSLTYLPGSVNDDPLHHRGLDDLRRVALHNHLVRNELALLNESILPPKPQTDNLNKSRSERKMRRQSLHQRSHSFPDLSKLYSSQLEYEYYHSEPNQSDTSDTQVIPNQSDNQECYHSKNNQSDNQDYYHFKNYRSDTRHYNHSKSSESDDQDYYPLKNQSDNQDYYQPENNQRNDTVDYHSHIEYRDEYYSSESSDNYDDYFKLNRNNHGNSTEYRPTFTSGYDVTDADDVTFNSDDVTGYDDEAGDVIPEELNIDELLSEGIYDQMCIENETTLENEFYHFNSVLEDRGESYDSFERRILGDLLDDVRPTGVRLSPVPEVNDVTQSFVTSSYEAVSTSRASYRRPNKRRQNKRHRKKLKIRQASASSELVKPQSIQTSEKLKALRKKSRSMVELRIIDTSGNMELYNFEDFESEPVLRDNGRVVYSNGYTPTNNHRPSKVGSEKSSSSSSERQDRPRPLHPRHKYGLYSSYSTLHRHTESANGKEFVRSKTLSMIPVHQILLPQDATPDPRLSPIPGRKSSGSSLSKMLAPDVSGEVRYRSKSAERGKLLKTPSPFRRKKSTAWAADDDDDSIYDPLTPCSSDDTYLPTTQLYYTTPPKQMATTPNSEDGRSRLDRSSSTKGGLSRLARRLSQKERRTSAVDRKKALRQRSVSLDCLQQDEGGGAGGDGRRSLMSLPPDPHACVERSRSIPTSPSLPTKLSKTSGASSPNLPGRLSRRSSGSKVRKDGKRFTSEVQALFDAVEHQDMDAAKSLLDSNGIDINCVNGDDLTPLDIAIMSNHVPMARMLQAHGGRENPKFHQSSESRALSLISLVKEKGRKVAELRQLVANPDSANVSISTGQQKEHELALQQWEFRHRLYKRMKAGYEHAREPSEPTNIQLTVASSTTLLVQFEEPECHNDALVTRYKVEWSCFEDFGELKGEKVLDDVLNLQYEITNLVQGNMYYVRVIASNMKGFGPPARSEPPSAVPSSWREVDSLKPRPDGRLKLMDSLFANIKNSRPPDASAIKDGIMPAGSPIHPRRSNMRKSLKNLFASAPKFQKTVKRGVYLAVLLYSEDRVVVTNDEVLPVMEVDENFALNNLYVDFHWLMKIACTWEDVKSLKQDMDKLANSSSVLFRSKLLNVVAQLQSALGIQDLGQFYYKPVRDNNGSIILVTVNYIRDPKVINTTHVRWMPFSKIQKRIGGTPEDMTTPELLFSMVSEMMLYNQVNTLPLSKGLYLGYLKLKSSVDLIRIMVPQRTPNVLPHVRIRDNNNISREEWEWVRNLDNNDVTGPQTGAQAAFHKELMAGCEHLLESLGITEDEAISHRLYDLEVIELSNEVSFILLLPPIEGVCSIPGHSEELMEQPGYLTLPVQVFEMIHMCTYQYDLISRYSRLSSILEMDTYLAQQAQREAFSSEEIAGSKERVEELSRFQGRLDDVWKGLRWTMDIIQYARDKNVRGGLPLGVLFAPPPSPGDSPNLERKDVDHPASSNSSDMGYHSDRSSLDQNMDLSLTDNQRPVSGEGLTHCDSETRDDSVWTKQSSQRGVLRVYAAYETGLAKGTSVKLHVTPRTTSREVINLVVQQLNKAVLTKGRTEPVYGDEQLEDFCLVAVIGARERILRDDYQPLQLQNPWTKGRLFVRLKANILAALEQGHVTSV